MQSKRLSVSKRENYCSRRDSRIKQSYPDLNDENFDSRSNRRVMRNMELTTGVTNGTLAKDIKKSMSPSRSQTFYLVPPMPVQPSTEAYPSTNVIKRRLSEFYNKQEMIETERARKQAKKTKKIEAQKAKEAAELAYRKWKHFYLLTFLIFFSFLFGREQNEAC